MSNKQSKELKSNELRDILETFGIVTTKLSMIMEKRIIKHFAEKYKKKVLSVDELFVFICEFKFNYDINTPQGIQQETIKMKQTGVKVYELAKAIHDEQGKRLENNNEK